jgi:hypothetical protein
MTGHIRRCVISSMIAQGMALTATGAILAAPLEPIDTLVTTGCSGHARMQPQDQKVAPLDTTFSCSGTTGRLNSGGMRIEDGSQLGNLPNFRARATVDALAGAELTQLADNQYVLTLSTGAGGLYTPDASMPLASFSLDARSRVQAKATFRILDLDDRQKSTPATIYYRLEQFGTLHTINNLRAASTTSINLTASGFSPSLSYNNMLETPTFPPGFQDVEFTGTRNYVSEGTLTSYTDGLITLNAVLESQIGPTTSANATSIRCGADSRFDSGIRLYMTVMPEPATMLLMAAGLGIAAARRRRQRCG